MGVVETSEQRVIGVRSGFGVGVVVLGLDGGSVFDGGEEHGAGFADGLVPAVVLDRRAQYPLPSRRLLASARRARIAGPAASAGRIAGWAVAVIQVTCGGGGEHTFEVCTDMFMPVRDCTPVLIGYARNYDRTVVNGKE
ncbi:MAG: hypothetical protein L0H96_12670 [Humibacillus sp.]|nr:hypothetical protein [Humibacillus sp.]MDN5777759.1 hypothetical protein [Humibacillus sp.]